MKTLTHILDYTDHNTRCHWCNTKAKHILTYSQTQNENTKWKKADTIKVGIYACEKCKDEKRTDKKLNMEDKS